MRDFLRKHPRLVRRAILYSVVLIFILYQWPRSYAVGYVKAALFDYAKECKVQEGDLVFQQMSGVLMDVVVDVMQNPYTHCGIVVRKPEGYYVLEAVGPVKETPFDLWVAQGVGQKIAVARLKSQFRPLVEEMIREGRSFIGRPYDPRYRWDDEHIYCSELIYKSFQRSSGLILADFVKLKDLHWKKYEAFIRNLDGGNLPLERAMILPISLLRSDKVTLVYSTF